MSTMKDYIEHYKDISFEEIPFNEVDNLILAQLSYFEFTGIVPNDKGMIPFEQALEEYYIRYPYKPTRKHLIGIDATIYIYHDLYHGKRYKDLQLSNYVNEIDEQQQFSALLIHFPNRMVYVSYSGTDDSIIGWEEDFNMAYLFPVPSQKRAITYINSAINWRDRKIYIGGHSKGGNLAMVAAMYAKASIRSRIHTVFNNEGPGFSKEIVESKAYQLMSKKMKMYVPSDSVIGMLFYHPENYIVVSSNAKGILQHDGNTWECFGGHFIRAKRTRESIQNEMKIKRWINYYDFKEREKIVVNFFQVLKKSGIEKKSQLDNLTIRKVITMVNQFRIVPPEEKEILVDAFRTFFTIYRGADPKEKTKKVAV